MPEDTQGLIRRHLAAWRRGDVSALLEDYTDDAVMLTEQGVVSGKDALGAALQEIFTSLFRPEDTRLEVTAEVISGDFALVHWTATTSTITTRGGFDTFTLRNGKIAAQCGGAEFVALD